MSSSSGHGEGYGPEIHDSRRPGFFWVDRAASDVLRRRFAGRELATARAVYGALAEIANEHRADDFTAGRRRVASYAGVSDRTLDRYAREFEALGLLRVERRVNGAQNLPNVWHLIDRRKGRPSGGKVVSLPARGGEAASPGGEANRTRGGEANRTRLKKHYKKETSPRFKPGGEKARNLSRFDEVDQ